MIHSLKNSLGWDDELYREILDDRYGKGSSKELSHIEAKNFISTFETRAVEMGVWKKKNKKTSVKSDNRDEFATEKQIKLIQALWGQVSTTPEAEARAIALRRFLKRIVGVDDLRFLLKGDVEKVVKALEAMGAVYVR
jgi:hypothetical protein